MAGAEGSPRVVLAVVTGGHGIRGEVRLKSFAEDPAALTDYGPLERSDRGAPLEVVALRPTKDGLIARFAGVGDRNAADALKGVELSVPRGRLPEPGPDEFYFADLVGLAAVRPDGEALGKVIAVHNFGAGDVIEVELAGSLETILVPFTREAVPEVDVAAGRLVVDPPEGLLDE
jgi:16S rRNA processing protein RimM